MPDITLEMTLKYDKCRSSQNENILYFIFNSFCKDKLIDKLYKLMLKLLSQKLKSEEIVCRKHATIRISFKSLGTFGETVFKNISVIQTFEQWCIL